MNMYKKTQLFVFDMILSVLILIIALTVIFMYYVNTTDNLDLYRLNQDILNGLTTTNINSLNDDYFINLFQKNKIRNIENTVAQQIVEFYYTSEEEIAKNLTENYVKSFIDKQMNFNISIKNDTMTNYDTLFTKINNPNVPLENASLVSVTKRIVFAYRGKDDFYGPATFKIEIWM